MCSLSKHTTESKSYSPPLNPPLEMNYICSNWKPFFSPFVTRLLFLVIPLKDNVPERPCASLLCIFIISQPLPSASHPIFLCLNLQDPADSGALTRTHLHCGGVFQRGANRLWQRPKVSETVQYNKTHRTRRSTSQCTANGPENNGCALLMVFIIAIKLLLAYSIGRDIMQNENESIHYWFDVNCVMEISLCAGEESVTRRHCISRLYLRLPGLLCSQRDGDVCVHVCLCYYGCTPLSALTHSLFCWVKKVNLCTEAFSWLEGLTIKLQLSLREMKPKSIQHLSPSLSPHVEIPSAAPYLKALSLALSWR